MEGVNKIQLLDQATMQKLSFVNINGTVYFGEITISEEVFDVKNAIIPTAGNITDIVKQWAKARNNGELRNPVVGGNIAYNKEELNELQQMELAQAVASINFKLKRCLTNIANGAIEEA